DRPRRGRGEPDPRPPEHHRRPRRRPDPLRRREARLERRSDPGAGGRVRGARGLRWMGRSRVVRGHRDSGGAGGRGGGFRVLPAGVATCNRSTTAGTDDGRLTTDDVFSWELGAVDFPQITLKYLSN